MSEVIEAFNYGEWIDTLCFHYKEEDILFRKSGTSFENALVSASPNVTKIVGVFNYDKSIGKIFI